MMKKIILYSLLLIHTLLASCSLVNVIDQVPPNDLVPENAITDEASAELALNGVYSYFQRNLNYIKLGAVPAFSSGYLTANKALLNWEANYEENNARSTTFDLLDFWTGFYKAINAANTVIAEVGKLPEDKFKGARKEEILAEAHFLRAMFHFDLLRYFGEYYKMDSDRGIIIKDTPTTLNTVKTGRSTVKASYEFIGQELEYAIKHAPEFTEPYRVSKWVAKALKARIALYTGDYTQAASIAEDVIQNSGLTLAETYQSFFEQGYNAPGLLFSQGSDQQSQEQDYRFDAYGEGYWSASESFENVIGDDPRKAMIIGGDADWGTQLPKLIAATELQPVYYFRLAEMYLIKAEALARNGASLSEAQAPFNIIRDRAGATLSQATNQQELLEEIYKEIVIELGFENGHEWFAAIRFGKALDLKEEITEAYQYILPIPLGELQVNDLLSQNPGYEQE
ncbi:RagB/SusD family nutrient uptake outer membrane protein [Rapidithrix thailandica]|uniref:RagB/SusD family nutrient uptake outer membrane protein n=1 Tax=Rapidithrix thailandica TaxID=413964 RepID=A0AAW9RNU1_9BACT